MFIRTKYIYFAMKRLLFVFLFIIESGYIFAQYSSVDGNSFEFSTLGGVQYNPGDHPQGYDEHHISAYWVVTQEEDELSECEQLFIRECFLEGYPGHTIIEEPTTTYNCHGYSHSISQGGDTCKMYWFPELCIGGYSLEETPQKGDIAVVRTYENEYDFSPYSVHSSIVVNEDTLISKWGENGPLTKHHKYDVVGFIQVDTVNIYTYYRRIINTPDHISGPYTFNGTGVFDFYPSITPTSCSWSVEPADMFQVSSGTGDRAILNYRIPFVYLAPKATITFTFSYGCDNHYTVSKEFDLRIPTTTVLGNAISDGFIIDADAVVTVTGQIKSNKNTKTIVPIGTKLILNGGKMTSNGDVMWQGIEVWGDNSTHQQESHGHYLQGYLEMRNGAVIENAKCAVELWRPGYYSTTGGIIHATDATFRNNAKAVHALYYNYSPFGGTSGYNGYLHNCTLAIDEDYLGSEIFYKHVDLSHIGGFDIQGCSFSTERNVTGVSHHCVGIGAYSAGFMVNSYCDLPSGSNMTVCPEEHLVPSSFTNFYQGIHASNDNSSALAFRVDNSVFYNNTFGIYALNTGYGTILNNDFTVGCGSDCDFGIYADGVSAFCIEDNAFHPKALNLGSPYGIVVVNSEGTNDIYRNDFKNLYCGNVAVGVNTNNTLRNISISGLTYTCNTNLGNSIDFCVLKDGNTGDIASQQGSMVLPAGNTFSGSQYHFYNDGNQGIEYYYKLNDSSQTPTNTLLYRVSAQFTNNSNSCQSHYNGGSVNKSPAEKAALASDYLSARTTYNNLLQLYESRIDGGSTPTQVADINNSVPSDMWRLRTQLLGLSPYVSGEVLTTAADRYDVFTDPVLFEILAANPDELKKDTLISYLENKEHPLPAYMTEMLRQMASGFTARTALQAQMAHYGHAYRLAAGDIVRSCLNDSITDLTELRTWLANMDDLASDRMIVASFLQEGDSIHAFALANMLPELYGLQGDALVDHADYMSLIGLYQTLNRENRTVYELTDAEIAMINSIATSGTGTSKVMAEALLMERSGEVLLSSYCPSMPGNNDGGRRMSNVDYTSLAEAMGFAISLSPNPASTWATVKYTLPVDAPKASLSLTNALGVTVATYDLVGNESQKVLDLRGLADGVYTYIVRCGKYSQTGKMVVVK